jgi:hypothetical protein
MRSSAACKSRPLALPPSCKREAIRPCADPAWSDTGGSLGVSPTHRIGGEYDKWSSDAEGQCKHKKKEESIESGKQQKVSPIVSQSFSLRL